MVRAEFDRKYDHYDSVRTQEGLNAVWSIYEVDDLYAQHPFQDAVEVCYHRDSHWGRENIVRKIGENGQRTDRWVDLFRAANYCIRNSGDNHHIYIEQFKPSSIAPSVLFLHTGS